MGESHYRNRAYQQRVAPVDEGSVDIISSIIHLIIP